MTPSTPLHDFPRVRACMRHLINLRLSFPMRLLLTYYLQNAYLQKGLPRAFWTPELLMLISATSGLLHALTVPILIKSKYF